MKVIVTKDGIRITTNKGDMPVDPVNKIDWSCRMASIEAMAWAAQMLNEEIQKSMEFYRTGKHDNDKASID
jgi:hypothetical protein